MATQDIFIYAYTPIDPTCFRTWTSIQTRGLTEKLPLYSGIFPLKIIHGIRDHIDTAPIKWIPFPLPATEPPIVGSLPFDRVVMFLIGRMIAQKMNALFYCVQLNKIDRDKKKMITSPDVEWPGHLSSIFTFLYADDLAHFPGINTVIEAIEELPFGPTLEMIMAKIGANICNDFIYVPMRKVNGTLTFPIVPNPNASDLSAREVPSDIHVPLVFVEPLRMVPHAPIYNLDGSKFEWQLYIIAGDVLIVPFYSNRDPISWIQWRALICAAEHKVTYVRAIVCIDLVTWNIHTTDYYVPSQ